MPLDGKCPDCGEALTPRARKCSCGWAQPTVGTSSRGTATDANWWRCCDTNQFGERCSQAGTWSPGTTGTGPWYCRRHDPASRSMAGARTGPPSGWQAIKDTARWPMREIGEEG